MKEKKRFFFIVLGVYCFAMAGCSGVSVVPAILEEQVNQEISFTDVFHDPQKYRGEILVFGGQVLSVKLLKHSTQIEILQLPLNRSMKPGESLQYSQGRFLAIEEEFLDPATLPFGTRVTVVGEVSGMMTLPLDETTYDFPTLVIKQLTVWPTDLPYQATRPYPYIYPYWGPYWGLYRAPYWGWWH